MTQHLLSMIVGCFFSIACLTPAFAEEELQTLLERLLAQPTISAETGFAAKVLVSPGHVYDPLIMVPHNGAVLLNDDGKEQGETGSRLLSISPAGQVSVLVDADKLLPVAGFDIAPDGFGKFVGQFFTLALPAVGQAGLMGNYIIQRVDPQKNYAAHILCTLPELGEGKRSSFGVNAIFGPAGSPFAGKLYALTALNQTIYQVTADGQCAPFVTFDAERVGTPFGFVFAPDGESLIVTVARGNLLAPTSSAIVRVMSDGTMADTPLAEGTTLLAGIDIAPEGFGSYGGQVFVTDAGRFEAPVPMTQTLPADGKVYRVTPEGKLALVASGFVDPLNLRFIGNTLWVTDINGDFMIGKRELPDGFIVEISVE
jgi:hypothetical protein